MPIDPRTITDTRIGTPLRDGAVDPLPGDFLGPTNAGETGELGNPHGPTVVNPEIHALQDNRPVRPGLVADDPAVQSAEETAHLQQWQGQTAPPPPAWAAQTAYAVGDQVTITDGTVLTASVAGTSGDVEPTGPGVDGTVTWE